MLCCFFESRTVARGRKWTKMILLFLDVYAVDRINRANSACVIIPLCACTSLGLISRQQKQKNKTKRVGGHRKPFSGCESMRMKLCLYPWLQEENGALRNSVLEIAGVRSRPACVVIACSGIWVVNKCRAMGGCLRGNSAAPWSGRELL